MSIARQVYEPVAQEFNIQNRSHKVLFIIQTSASLIAVVLAVTALIVAVVSKSNNKEYKENVNIGQLDEIELKSSELKKLMNRIEKELGDKKKNFSVPSGNSLSVLPNAHIGFKVSEEKSVRPTFDNNHPEKLSLDELNAEIYHNSVQVSAGGITILSSGLYYVYSSVTYKLTNVSCLDLEFQTWYHYVQRTSTSEYPTNGILLRTVHTCSDQQLPGSGESKFIGGVFYLEEGDIISALCSGLNLVRGGNNRSFIGLFMLSK